MRTRNLFVVGAGLLIAATAFAWPGEEPPPPPPPPEINDCSPGFWKNHPEYWATQFCGSSTCVDTYMELLSAKGPGSGDLRSFAAGALNSWADVYYGGLVCTD